VSNPVQRHASGKLARSKHAAGAAVHPCPRGASIRVHGPGTYRRGATKWASWMRTSEPATSAAATTALRFASASEWVRSPSIRIRASHSHTLTQWWSASSRAWPCAARWTAADPSRAAVASSVSASHPLHRDAGLAGMAQIGPCFISRHRPNEKKDLSPRTKTDSGFVGHSFLPAGTTPSEEEGGREPACNTRRGARGAEPKVADRTPGWRR
jgi:hypothetical protein